MLRVIVATALVLVAAPAGAQEAKLGRDGSSVVFVWKDSDSQSEAYRLINAGVHKSNPVLLFRLMSCMPKPGDRAVVTDGGFASSTIVVTSGEESGCRGVIANEDLNR